MKKLIITSGVFAFLLFAGCTKEKISKTKPTVEIPHRTMVQEETGLTGKKDNDCLINVYHNGGYIIGNQWYTGVSYENLEPHKKKSILITLYSCGTPTPIINQEINNIPFGRGNYRFNFPITGAPPQCWNLIVQSYDKPKVPKHREEYCGILRVIYEIFGNPCINYSQICNTCNCPQVIDPVCGCSGVTYNNSCEAQSAGEISWTSGQCGL